MTLKNEIVCQNLILWTFDRVIFDNFGVQKSNILDFFNVVYELLRKFINIVFVLEGLLLRAF